MGLRLWGPRLRKFVLIGGSLCGLVLVAMVALWWRLSSGPIELDIATPWLTAAIKENFGAGHDVEIGGTQIERDANGRTSLRIRDIVVRDAEGTIVASAPKAEVGVSGTGLLTGRIRAERLSLVGAEMAVRIESDSKVTVFAGGNKRPFVTASANAAPGLSGSAPAAAKLERAAALGTAAPPVPARRPRRRRQLSPATAFPTSPCCWPGSRASMPAAWMAATSPRSASRAATSPSTISATASSGRSPISISA